MAGANFTEESVPMSNETRGHAIKRRRYKLGILSLEDFERATGIGRKTISKAEAGDPTVRDSTYLKLETWLDGFEHETSSDAEDVADAVAALDAEPKAVEEERPKTVSFRLAGNFGVDVIVEGPVENMEELEASVEKLLRQMQNKRQQD